MDSNYLDDLFAEIEDMEDIQDIWDEYDRQKASGEEDYYDWKWRNTPSVPSHMLDQIVEDFDEDYVWDEVEETFKQRLGDDFYRRDKLELAEKLDDELPVHGVNRKKPKV